MVPLALTLDGDATIFAFMTTVELNMEMGRSDASYWHTWRR
jgi:hypothetical protein